jgi:imidazolonepropionase-like amidohydrolase
VIERRFGAFESVRDFGHQEVGLSAADDRHDAAPGVLADRADLGVVAERGRAPRHVNDGDPGCLAFKPHRLLAQDRRARQHALEEVRHHDVAQPAAEDRRIRLEIVVGARENVEVRGADDTVEPPFLAQESHRAGCRLEAVDQDRTRAERRFHREKLAGSRVESGEQLALLVGARGCRGQCEAPRRRRCSEKSHQPGEGERHMLIRVLVALACLLPVSGHTNPPIGKNVIVINGATIVHPSQNGAGALESGATILIQGDRIQLAGAGITLELPQGATIIDGRGKWVIPGLVDSHVHFFQSGNLYTRPDAADFNAVVPYADEVARNKARLDATFKVWLASGVTGVVDIGGPMWNFDVRDRAAASDAAPRMAVAGPLISMIDDPPLDLGDPPIIRITSADAARALVARQLARDPDYIKVWFIHEQGDDLAAQEAIVRAAGDAAHAAGKKFAVHATELVVAKAALRAGADLLVHSVFDAPVDDEFIALAKKNNVLYVPTLFVMQGYQFALSNQWRATPEELKRADPEILAAMDDLNEIPADKRPKHVAKLMVAATAPAAPRIAMENLKKLSDAGIAIVMGTDAGNIGTLHGPSIHREMRLMQQSGLTPLEVLRSATTNGANALRLEGKTGAVAPGMLADLVILDADPLADVSNLARVYRTIKGGVVYDPEALMEAIR